VYFIHLHCVLFYCNCGCGLSVLCNKEYDDDDDELYAVLPGVVVSSNTNEGAEIAGLDWLEKKTKW